MPLNHGDNVIAILNVDGSVSEVGKPKGPINRSNFLITWNSMDWSGFGTLLNIAKRFEELGKEYNGKEFKIVERL